MTEIELLKGLDTEIPGWVLQSRLAERGYANIWQKIEGLIADGLIERVMRGWYCLGPLLRKREPSLRYLACNVYGPAAVSGNLVLFEAGLIPDAVASVISVTPKRSRSLETPYGNIHWLTVPRSSVFAGTYAVNEPPGYIRATTEKALLDQLYITRYTPQSYNLWKAFILEDLRIDEDALERLDLANMHELGRRYKSPKIIKHIKWFNKYLGVHNK
ncbi:MAG: hypothetical protein PHO18_05025 [Synergistaceae bacterium]|nr:hypothetical protein [Synergistaceae bacterium]